MAVGKLSETVRGVAEHLDPVALAWARMARTALHGMASALEALPFTIPGPKVPPPPPTPVVPED